MTQPTLIEIRDLTFSYGATPVLEGVNLSIPAGEALCIVGPNGGGKTTLLKLILGLLRPTQGTLRVFGEPPGRACRKVGYMPQYLQFDALFPVTVQDIVLMGRLGGEGLAGWLGWYTRADRLAALEVLEDVGMADFRYRRFATLSGGQRQRVLLARALVTRPELLLLDEPTANVDSAAEARLGAILQQLRSRMTVLMVSHDLGFVSGIVQHVVCVNRTVVMHPTGRLSGEMIESLYGGEPLRAVLHGEQCPNVRHVHHD